MGIFIVVSFALAFLVLVNEICKLGPGGDLRSRTRRLLLRAFGRAPEPRGIYTSAVPGLGHPAQSHTEPIVWDEPEDTREIWPLSSLADEISSVGAPHDQRFVFVDDELEEATVPRA